MHYNYGVKGICARAVEFDIEEGILKNIVFAGGCNGNQKGLAALAEGMSVEEATKRLKGITCGNKRSSCPDQLAIALEKCLTNK